MISMPEESPKLTIALAVEKFGSKENLAQIRRFVEADPLTIYGLKNDGGDLYASHLSTLLGIEKRDIYHLPLHVGTKGTSGFSKRYMEGRKVIVVSASIVKPEDIERHQLIAKDVKKIKEPYGMLDFRLVVANPEFRMYTLEELLQYASNPEPPHNDGTRKYVQEAMASLKRG